MAAKFGHVALAVDNMELMRGFYTRVIGLDETAHLLFEHPETSSPTPGAIPYPGIYEFPGVSWDRKVEDLQYKDEDHDLVFVLMKEHNKPSKDRDESARSPLFEGHVGYLVDDLPSVLQRMGEEQLGKIVKTSGPDGAPTHAYIFDPEGNAVELKAMQPNA